jgi:transposase
MRQTADARSLSTEAQEALRKRAVAVILAGMKQRAAARVFGVTPRAVSKWMRAYRRAGARGLKAGQRGRPRGGRLLPWQCATIVRLIKDRDPKQLKLPFYLWTREAVRDLIQQRFGITYSLCQVGRYLRRWGFTPQKPVRKAYEQSSKAVQRWLDEQYPAIAKRAKQQKAEIHWCDEMGMRSDCPTGRGFSPRGKTPVAFAPGTRFGCNMISTLTNRGKLRFMVFKESFDKYVFIRFLKRLLKGTDRKIFLIVDGHPAHRSRLTAEFVEAHQDRIELYRLPSYSPELNPDELVNQDVKTNAVNRQRARTQTDMIRNVRGYLHSRQKRPEIVRRYFHAPTVRYAAAG